MARAIYDNTMAQPDSTGTLKGLSGISVRVRKQGSATTSFATIYGSRTGAAISNPITTGAGGALTFWADEGEYELDFSDAQSPPRISPHTRYWMAIPAEDLAGPVASRPSAGSAGRTYYATDQDILYVDTGSTWRAQINSSDTRLINERVPPDGTVSTVKIQPGAVTTDRIPNEAVTDAKLNASNLTYAWANRDIEVVHGAVTWIAPAVIYHLEGITYSGSLWTIEQPGYYFMSSTLWLGQAVYNGWVHWMWQSASPTGSFANLTGVEAITQYRGAQAFASCTASGIIHLGKGVRLRTCSNGNGLEGGTTYKIEARTNWMIRYLGS